MTLKEQFLLFVNQHQLFTRRDRLLIAVSGGVDSVVLCALCKEAGFNFGMAHVNFGLRGSESDADSQLVQELALAYGVSFHVTNFDTKQHASELGLTIQETARILRYNWFGSLMKSNENPNGYDRLLTAHHANDNIETVLMNFFKGTGIRGLEGIGEKSKGLVKGLVRPLLFAEKKELYDYAKSHGLAWREDTSNSGNDYSRNYIRNEIMPVVQKLYPGVEQNLLDNIRKFREAGELYRYALNQIRGQLVELRGEESWIPVLKLRQYPAFATVLFEIVSEAGFKASQLPGLLKLLNSDSGKYVQSASHRLLRNRNWLILGKIPDHASTFIVIEKGQPQIKANGFTLLIKQQTAATSISSDPNIAQLDASGFEYPLLLRKWKQGDYFYPLGMDKKKKLSRFFIDRKLPLSQKENTWVLESKGRILWVLGLQIDNRCKVTAHSKQTVQFHLIPAK